MCEYLFSDKNSHAYKHLNSSTACREACDEKCLTVLDSANTAYKLKIKEALHIMWEGPNLNKQLNHDNILPNFQLSLPTASFFFSYLYSFFDLYSPIRLIERNSYSYVP